MTANIPITAEILTQQVPTEVLEEKDVEKYYNLVQQITTEYNKYIVIIETCLNKQERICPEPTNLINSSNNLIKILTKINNPIANKLKTNIETHLKSVTDRYLNKVLTDSHIETKKLHYDTVLMNINQIINLIQNTNTINELFSYKIVKNYRLKMVKNYTLQNKLIQLQQINNDNIAQIKVLLDEKTFKSDINETLLEENILINEILNVTINNTTLIETVNENIETVNENIETVNENIKKSISYISLLNPLSNEDINNRIKAIIENDNENDTENENTIFNSVISGSGVSVFLNPKPQNSNEDMIKELYETIIRSMPSIEVLINQNKLSKTDIYKAIYTNLLEQLRSLTPSITELQNILFTDYLKLGHLNPNKITNSIGVMQLLDFIFGDNNIKKDILNHFHELKNNLDNISNKTERNMEANTIEEYYLTETDSENENIASNVNNMITAIILTINTQFTDINNKIIFMLKINEMCMYYYIVANKIYDNLFDIFMNYGFTYIIDRNNDFTVGIPGLTQPILIPDKTTDETIILQNKKIINTIVHSQRFYDNLIKPLIQLIDNFQTNINTRDNKKESYNYLITEYGRKSIKLPDAMESITDILVIVATEYFKSFECITKYERGIIDENDRPATNLCSYLIDQDLLFLNAEITDEYKKSSSDINGLRYIDVIKNSVKYLLNYYYSKPWSTEPSYTRGINGDFDEETYINAYNLFIRKIKEQVDEDGVQNFNNVKILKRYLFDYCVWQTYDQYFKLKFGERGNSFGFSNTGTAIRWLDYLNLRETWKKPLIKSFYKSLSTSEYNYEYVYGDTIEVKEISEKDLLGVSRSARPSIYSSINEKEKELQKFEQKIDTEIIKLEQIKFNTKYIINCLFALIGYTTELSRNSERYSENSTDFKHLNNYFTFKQKLIEEYEKPVNQYSISDINNNYDTIMDNITNASYAMLCPELFAYYTNVFEFYNRITTLKKEYTEYKTTNKNIYKYNSLVEYAYNLLTKSTKPTDIRANKTTDFGYVSYIKTHSQTFLHMYCTENSSIFDIQKCYIRLRVYKERYIDGECVRNNLLTIYPNNVDLKDKRENRTNKEELLYNDLTKSAKDILQYEIEINSRPITICNIYTMYVICIWLRDIFFKKTPNNTNSEESVIYEPNENYIEIQSLTDLSHLTIIPLIYNLKNSAIWFEKEMELNDTQQNLATQIKEYTKLLYNYDRTYEYDKKDNTKRNNLMEIMTTCYTHINTFMHMKFENGYNILTQQIRTLKIPVPSPNIINLCSMYVQAGYLYLSESEMNEIFQNNPTKNKEMYDYQIKGLIVLKPKKLNNAFNTLVYKHVHKSMQPINPLYMLDVTKVVPYLQQQILPPIKTQPSSGVVTSATPMPPKATYSIDLNVEQIIGDVNDNKYHVKITTPNNNLSNNINYNIDTLVKTADKEQSNIKLPVNTCITLQYIFYNFCESIKITHTNNIHYNTNLECINNYLKYILIRYLTSITYYNTQSYQDIIQSLKTTITHYITTNILEIKTIDLEKCKRYNSNSELYIKKIQLYIDTKFFYTDSNTEPIYTTIKTIPNIIPFDNNFFNLQDNFNTIKRNLYNKINNEQNHIQYEQNNIFLLQIIVVIIDNIKEYVSEQNLLLLYYNEMIKVISNSNTRISNSNTRDADFKILYTDLIKEILNKLVHTLYNYCIGINTNDISEEIKNIDSTYLTNNELNSIIDPLIELIQTKLNTLIPPENLNADDLDEFKRVVLTTLTV